MGLPYPSNDLFASKNSRIERDLETDQAIYASNLETIDTINSWRADGWKQKTEGEIESLYKSLGIRIGIRAKF